MKVLYFGVVVLFLLVNYFSIHKSIAVGNLTVDQTRETIADSSSEEIGNADSAPKRLSESLENLYLKQDVIPNRKINAEYFCDDIVGYLAEYSNDLTIFSLALTCKSINQSVEIVRKKRIQNLLNSILSVEFPGIKAAEAGDIKVIMILAEFLSTELLVVDGYQSTPILVAARSNHFNIVKIIAEILPEALLAVDVFGNTVAHWAAHNGNLEVLNLMEKNAPGLLKKSNELGNTPIHYAALAAEIPVLEFFLEKYPESFKIKNKLKQRPQDMVPKRFLLPQKFL
jgi:hypothetical protein